MRLVESLRYMKGINRKNKKLLWSMYIDLKSAFDSVDHKILFRKMRRLGIDQNLIQTIEWLYNQTQFLVGEERVEIGRGVIQGGVLSPTLFIIMFNDLMVELKR